MTENGGKYPKPITLYTLARVYYNPQHVLQLHAVAQKLEISRAKFYLKCCDPYIIFVKMRLRIPKEKITKTYNWPKNPI